jgi:hypothetical protein
MNCGNRECDFWKESEANHCRIVICPSPESCNRFVGDASAQEKDAE